MAVIGDIFALHVVIIGISILPHSLCFGAQNGESVVLMQQTINGVDVSYHPDEFTITYPFQNYSLSWEERLDDLVSRLTLEEIVNQTIARWAMTTIFKCSTIILVVSHVPRRIYKSKLLKIFCIYCIYGKFLIFMNIQEHKEVRKHIHKYSISGENVSFEK